MSGVEPLARVLEPYETFVDTDGHLSTRILSGQTLAERILADPGPLLAALAEAGVLREWREQFVRDGYGEAPLSVLGEVSEPYWKSCYVTEWQEVQP